MTDDYDNYWEYEDEWDDRTEQIKLDAQEYEYDNQEYEDECEEEDEKEEE